MSKPWGWSLALNCYGCNAQAIRNEKVLFDWVVELVKRIDMVAYGEPLIENFGHDDKAGYTVVQLIQTSNITAHFSNDTNSAYIDVFSCKPFEIETVEDVIEEFFSPISISSHMLERLAG